VGLNLSSPFISKVSRYTFPQSYIPGFIKFFKSTQVEKYLDY
jgi:hypothetical protein